MKPRILLAFLCLLICLPLQALAQSSERAVIGDYDADGLSDYTVTRQLGIGWYWLTRNSDGTEQPLRQFGLATADIFDFIYAGDFDGDGKFEPGVLRDHAGGYWWISRQNNGTALAVQWGLSGDGAHAGYFDNDQKQDRSVVRLIGKNLHWFVKRSAASSLVNLPWGLEGDATFAGDVNGDGIDELIVARKELSGFVNWYARELNGNVLPVISWGVHADQLLPPQDMNGDGIDDFIVVRNELGGLVFYVRHNSTQGIAEAPRVVTLGVSGNVPFVGHYSSDSKMNFGVFETYANNIARHVINMSEQSSIQINYGLEDDFLVTPEGRAYQATTFGIGYGEDCITSHECYWSCNPEGAANPIYEQLCRNTCSGHPTRCEVEAEPSSCVHLGPSCPWTCINEDRTIDGECLVRCSCA